MSRRRNVSRVLRGVQMFVDFQTMGNSGISGLGRRRVRQCGHRWLADLFRSIGL